MIARSIGLRAVAMGKLPFSQFQQADVDIVERASGFDGFFKLQQLHLRHKRFDGSWSELFQRELCLRGDAVGVLLYDPALEAFALVEQLRIGALGRSQSPWLLEIVAGMLDKPDESKAAVARRETAEEAGLEIDAITPMLEYFCSPGGSSEFFSLFCAKVDLAQVQSAIFGVADEHEDIRLHIVKVDDALQYLQQGIINNAMTVIALQWFQLHRAQLPELWAKLPALDCQHEA